MLTPEYLDRVSDEVANLYSEFELTILKDIARRISKMRYVTSTADFQIQQLQEAGLVYEKVIKEVSRLTGISEKEIADTFEDASVKAIRFDDSIYKANGLSPIPLGQSAAMLQVLDANILKTNGDLINLTRTTASNAQELFIRSTSLAQMQIQSGAFTANQAINSAVKTASREGLKVTYPTGAQRTVESAVRTSVLTGVNQTANKLQDIRANELGSDLVETTAHAGAREGEGYKGHVNWQGKVFSRSGRGKYPNFEETTGKNKIEGLGGINCRHSYYPYFEGQEKGYSKELLKSYKKNDVTYNGKTMSYYEATQKQRYMERNIRKWKTEASMMEVAGQDPTFAKAKVREWQAKTRDLVDQTSIKRDYSREKISR